MAVVSVVQNVNAALAVQEAISLIGGIESFVHPHDKVVIKPNLCTALPADTGMTTDPHVVQVIIELCKRVNPSDLTIAEGSGGSDTMMAFDRCGYRELAAKYDVQLVDLNESPTTLVPVPAGKAFQELSVPTIIRESDVLINVPKLKVYSRRNSVSLSLKNLMGAVPGKIEYSQHSSAEFPLKLSQEWWMPDGKFFLPHHRQWAGPRGEKKKIHKDFTNGIVDLNTVIKPSLTVIDGLIICRDPDILYPNPTTIELNTILASSDPLALDCITTRMGGQNPLDISYLKRASERGLGEADDNQIQIVGTPLHKITSIWETGLS